MNTQILERSIAACEDMEEFRLLMQENASLNQAWAGYVEEHIKPLRTRKRLTDQKLADGCGIRSLTTVGKFKKLIPSERKYVIMMAMMLGLNAEQTNELLVRGARYPRLYSRNPEDAIWIYLLERGGSDMPAALFDAYWDIYVQEQDRYDREQGKAPRRLPKGTVLVHDEITVAARRAKMASVSAAAADRIYRDLVRSHIQDYANGYWRLVEYIDKQFQPFRSSANERWKDHASFHHAYYERMQALRDRRELPSRLFLVALGIHLEMDKDSINKMLDLAGMGPLYAKDRLEGSVVFLLEELYCKMPSVFFKIRTDPAYGELLDGTDENGEPLLFRSSDPDGHDERLSEYIARKLDIMGLTAEADQEQSRIAKFLKWL